jgi:hypothetical protein
VPPLWTRSAVAVSALSVAVLSWALADRPILDTDYFWHLRTGALIAETGSVPRVDPFSYSAPGARWIDLHWLFQVGLHALYALGGHGATRIAGAALGLGVVGVSAATLWRNDRPASSGIALALLVVTAGVRFLLRPDTVSLLLAACVLALLWRDERRNDRWVFAIVPLQLLWANLHGFQAVGLALVAMALASEVCAPLGGRTRRTERVRRLGVVLALGAVAAVGNPNGLDGALLPLRQLAMIGPTATRGVFGQVVDELRSPLAGFDAHSIPALLAFVTLGAGSAAALWLDRRNVTLFDVLVWLAFLGLALSAVRNVALFAVAAAPLGAVHLGRWLDDTARISRTAQRAFGAAALGALAVAAGGVAIADAARTNGPRGSSDPALADFWYPERAVDWIERNRPPGPLYHRMGDGGYVIWRLWPTYPVLVDGRLEVYGEALYADIEVNGGGGPDTFERLDGRYRFGTALLHFGLFRDLSLLAWLVARPEWRLVHVDDVAAVLVRVDSASETRWPAVNLASPVLFEPLDAGPPHPMDLWRRTARISLLTVFGRLGDARALLAETRAKYDDPVLDRIRSLLDSAEGTR